jgi:hypothetical protein
MVANGLSSTLEGRGIKRVVHFHCDHFEPFRNDLSGGTIGLQHVEYWREQCTQHNYAKHASPFFLSHALTRVEPGARAEEIRFVPDDSIVLATSSFADEEKLVLNYLAGERVDLQVHIHHEYWSSGASTGVALDPELDAARLDAYLEYFLRSMRERTGLPSKHWGFVHGCWALNASDHEICHITNEIEILMRHGCVADFSFPAGRPWCNPTLFKVPYTCVPCNESKGYDTKRALGIRIDGLSKRESNRFMIWSTPNDAYAALSLDEVTSASRPPNWVVQMWLSQCPIINGTLYIKTHAHSMWWERWYNERITTTPLLSSNVAMAFDLLEHACGRHAVNVEYLTVSDVLKELRMAPDGN